jgi:hypothetical protein
MNDRCAALGHTPGFCADCESDPIRARLDLAHLSGMGSSCMHAALRAVLDLHTPHPRAMDGYCHTCGQRPCAIRRVIAEHLGVTDV